VFEENGEISVKLIAQKTVKFVTNRLGHVWSAIIMHSHIIAQTSVALIAIIPAMAESVHWIQGNVYMDVNY
jgi:hypothetical protein